MILDNFYRRTIHGGMPEPLPQDKLQHIPVITPDLAERDVTPDDERRFLVALFDAALAVHCDVTITGLPHHPLAYDMLKTWAATHGRAISITEEVRPGLATDPHPYIRARANFGLSEVLDGGIAILCARYATHEDVTNHNAWHSPTIDPSTVKEA